MKQQLTFLAMAATACWLAACKPADQRVPQADGAVPPRQEVRGRVDSASFEEQKTNAEAKLSTKLNDLDTKMAELKQKAQAGSDKAKAEWEAQRPKLEAQRAEASKKLDELKASTKETWEQVKTKTDAAFSELEQGFKNAWARLKE